MRLIDNQIAATSQSPVRELLHDIHTAIINIAPERSIEFDEKFKSFKIEYIDDDDFIANVDCKSNHIKISTGALEALWVLAYAHFQYYTQVVQKVGCETETEVGPNHLSGMLPAIDLLRWVMERLIKYVEWHERGGSKPERSPWPASLPSPLSSSNAFSDEGVASELTRGSLAALIHHELAHIALGHSGPSEIDSERDADMHSWDWIRDATGSRSDKADMKRILIILNPLLLGVTIDIRLKRNTLGSHPRNIDRLSSFLSHCDLDHQDLAYAFALTILQFHTGLTGDAYTTPGIVYKDFRHAFEAIADYISRFETTTKQKS